MSFLDENSGFTKWIYTQKASRAAILAYLLKSLGHNKMRTQTLLMAHINEINKDLPTDVSGQEFVDRVISELY